MAATLIEPSESMVPSSLAVCIYGTPGSGKSALAQTLRDPITLDLDRGAHRCFNRRALMRFDAWRDVDEAFHEIENRAEVVVDTVGRALDLLSAEIIEGNPKAGTRAGGLTLQGYGALKARFVQWNGQLFAAGKDRVFIAHEKEERDGDERIMRPDVQGGSYTELMKVCDLVGYLYRDRAGKRWLDFNPSDRHLGKNAAGWPIMEVPDLAGKSDFLAALLTDAKTRIGAVAAQSAKVAGVVEGWQARLAANPTLEELNAMLPELGSMSKPAGKQAWAVTKAFAERCGLLWNAKGKCFERKAGAA